MNVELFDVYQALLREQLNIFLQTLHPLLKEDVVRALQEPGKLFASDTSTRSVPAGVWSLLPLLIAQSLAPDIDQRDAASIAVAIECFICALDLLDDVEDEDQTAIVREIGIPRVLNTSTSLLALTNHIVLSLLKSSVSSEDILQIVNAIQDCLITATSAQHQDILAEKRMAESFTTEECIEISKGKAGALMSLACLTGALCAGSGNEVASQFSELGTLLGIAHQLDNDSRDLYHILNHVQMNTQTEFVKTDIARQKKTLPIVIAAHTLSELQSSRKIVLEEQSIWPSVLYEGIITARGISLLYRERAYEKLQQIESQNSISQALRFLLGFT